MALTLGDNFSYQGAKPLDARLKYDTVAAMKAVSDSTLYDGCLAYCTATEKTYQWKSTNTVDTTLGRWREFESGASVTVDDELSDTSENPVQNAVIKEALDGKADLVDGKVPAAQLPSYVDDVLEYEDKVHFPVTGETGKIYIAQDTNKTYRWGGSDYVEISESLALGETSSTAYRGDRGKTAYDISQTVGDVTNLTTTEKSSVVGAVNEINGKVQIVQYSSLPTASADNLGQIAQYIGATGGGLTNGYFYECVSDGEATPTYSWERRNVQPTGGYTAGDGIEISNTEISVDEMNSADMTEVANPIPSVMSRRFKYSTEEQVVGKWIDGKPLYQKTIYASNVYLGSSDASTGLVHGITNIDTMFVKYFSYNITDGWEYGGDVFIVGNGVYTAKVMCGSRGIWLKSKDNAVSFDASSSRRYVVILQYTKTTD